MPLRINKQLDKLFLFSPHNKTHFLALDNEVSSHQINFIAVHQVWWSLNLKPMCHENENKCTNELSQMRK